MNTELDKNLYKTDIFLLKLLPVIMFISHIISSYGAIFQINTGIEIII